MNNEVITDISQITLDWLNSVLNDSVEGFTITPSDSDNSKTAKIQLKYKSENLSTLPASLFLKICAIEDSPFGDSEVNYYIRDYINLKNPPIPTCYHAGYAENPRRYHLLLEDLSATHHSNRKITPTLRYGIAVAQALATLHIHFWGTEKLQTIAANIPSETEIERYIAHIKPGLLPMLKEVKNEIDSLWQSTLIDVFQYHPEKMIERTFNPSGFTLIHGDVNPGNILSPINGEGKIYLIDRQPFDWSLTTWLGVSEIAYLMVHWWEPELRRKWEIPILKEYHTSLIHNGIYDYNWEQLINDYKLSVVQTLYVAAAWCISEQDRHKMKWLWLRHLQRSMTALFDLQCFELWKN